MTWLAMIGAGIGCAVLYWLVDPPAVARRARPAAGALDAAVLAPTMFPPQPFTPTTNVDEAYCAGGLVARLNSIAGQG